MRLILLALIGCGIGISALARDDAGTSDMDDIRTYQSGREDGRYLSTLGFAHHLMKTPPKLAFDPDMKPEDFPKWQAAIRAKTLELMAFPENIPPQPAPGLACQTSNDGLMPGPSTLGLRANPDKEPTCQEMKDGSPISSLVAKRQRRDNIPAWGEAPREQHQDKKEC